MAYSLTSESTRGNLIILKKLPGDERFDRFRFSYRKLEDASSGSGLVKIATLYPNLRVASQRENCPFELVEHAIDVSRKSRELWMTSAILSVVFHTRETSRKGFPRSSNSNSSSSSGSVVV
ncbi:hypothetical protein M0802_005046 [Mischocyttarus mexicanus]|nr:hypothetical protein M0802_005046 [Mischocyttarus mexicanus]